MAGLVANSSASGTPALSRRAGSEVAPVVRTEELIS
jgi:hypothetical protein